MVRVVASNVARIAGRGVRTARFARAGLPVAGGAPTMTMAFGPASVGAAAPRFISGSTGLKGDMIMPDNKPRKADPEASVVTCTPAEMTDGEYHSVADDYMSRLLHHLEDFQDAREDIDVDFSAGVITLNCGTAGTYVINKQPPNKQIWLSSPTSGPKRYDYVILGDSQSDKQDTACGDWVYIRDGTTINELLHQELGIELTMPTGHYGE